MGVSRSKTNKRPIRPTAICGSICGHIAVSVCLCEQECDLLTRLWPASNSSQIILIFLLSLLLLLWLHFLFYLRVMPKERRHTCTHAHRRALQLYGEYKNRMRANYGQIDVC